MNDPTSVFLSYYTLDDMFEAMCGGNMPMMNHLPTRMNVLIKLLCDIQKETGSAELTTEQLANISQIMTAMEGQ